MVIKVKHNTNLYEKCVLCDAVTDVKLNHPVDARKYYVVGIGQLCQRCYMQIKAHGGTAEDKEKKTGSK